MSNLTSKELTAIEDQLGIEENLVKKYKMYAGACQDPQLKTKCEEIAAKHQSHFNTLMTHLS
ncbi:spore coat protein [Ruminococcaceae bacterium OttesenSCG-928-L11]|nr:spore coat protein [Ruminococcaceae bacterium OttesenSCG-928-L11]